VFAPTIIPAMAWDHALSIEYYLSWIWGHCKGNLTDSRRELHLSLAKGNPK
jgi:hypothetical protein